MIKFSFNLEDIKYIKILYTRADGAQCTEKAAIRRINEREIITCTKYDENLVVNTPQQVEISIVCGDGLYKTHTVLKSVDKEEPYNFFIIESPRQLDYQQNREYFRVAVQYQCEYKIFTEDGAKKFIAQTYDISANGVSILLPIRAIPEKNAEIKIDIEGREIISDLNYVRSEEINSGYKISFSFEDISEADRDYISQVCIKKQIEQKRNYLL